MEDPSLDQKLLLISIDRPQFTLYGDNQYVRFDDCAYGRDNSYFVLSADYFAGL